MRSLQWGLHNWECTLPNGGSPPRSVHSPLGSVHSRSQEHLSSSPKAHASAGKTPRPNMSSTSLHDDSGTPTNLTSAGIVADSGRQYLGHTEQACQALCAHQSICLSTPSLLVAPTFQNVPVSAMLMESSMPMRPVTQTSTGLPPQAIIFSRPPNSVATKPGAMARTAISFSLKSTPQLLTIMLTAHLEVRYAYVPPDPLSPMEA
mmetsp:Transcript_107611/g.343442  ORF Transcript_107611/g.343442 Transcript_107611/m.343442 type:complete len:205 (-) Transcript_107611:514-1128(-)